MKLDMILKLDDSLREGQLTHTQLKALFPADDQNEVDLYLKVNRKLEVIYAADNATQKFKSSLKTLNDEYFSKTVRHPMSIKKNRRPLRIFAAASSVVLVLGLGLFQFANMYHSPSAILEQRSVLNLYGTRGDAADIPLVEQLYESDQFAEAIKSLSGKAFETKYYLLLGNAHFSLGQYDQALFNYELLGERSNEYKKEIYYNSALAYIGKKDVKKALEIVDLAIMDENITTKNHFIQLKQALTHPLMMLTR